MINNNNTGIMMQKKNNIAELNPQARLAVNQISSSIYSKSYLTFILVMLICVGFTAYSIAETRNMDRQLKFITASMQEKISKLEEKLEINNVYMAKVLAQHEKLEEELQK